MYFHYIYLISQFTSLIIDRFLMFNLILFLILKHLLVFMTIKQHLAMERFFFDVSFLFIYSIFYL
jgi:hypothetical protein